MEAESLTSIVKDGLTIAAAIWAWMSHRRAKKATKAAEKSQAVVDWFKRRKERVVIVFLVEDDEDDAEMVARMFEKNDITYVALPDDESLYQKLPDESSVVILDYLLKRGNGMDAMREVKRRNPGNLPIIYTGSGDPLLATKFLNAGAFRYVNKNEPDALETLRIFTNEAIYQISNR